MNRIDRLFGILLLLQTKKRIHVSALAQAFEISERTIYRDIAALSEMGVPISTIWGDGYELLEGFYLPPLLFTEDEAKALVLGIQMLTLQAAGSILTHAYQTIEKIKLALPQSVRQQVEQQTKIIEFIVPQHRFNLDDSRLMLLQAGISRQTVMRVTYHSYTRDETTRRDIEPYALTYSEGVWYVKAYCRLRQGMRSFRLERIEILNPLSETFEKRDVQPEARQPIVVHVLFKAQNIRWVRERQHYTFATERVIEESGDILMEYHPDTLDEMKSWLLSWGAGAEVIAPQSLRDDLREEAIKLAKIMT